MAYFPPYPFYTTHGKGCKLYDLDGNEYIDCVNNMTSLVHGHAHPQVVAAICEQAAKGKVHAAPTELQSLHAEKICGSIPSMEPMLTSCGGVMPDKGYLTGLRDLADAHDVLLIFDEVITFRFSAGGMQVIEEIRPDLTALGKIIGGGLPVGAFGGRSDIMQMFDPTQPDAVTHSGTFSGNALTMAAGITTLDLLGQGEIDRINGLGGRLREHLKGAMDQVGVKGQVCGLGSVAFAMFFEGPYRNASEAVRSIVPTLELSQNFHLALLNEGIYAIAKGIMGFVVSTPMNDSTVDLIIERYKKALEHIKPVADAIER